MVAKIITIQAGQAGGTTVLLPEYEGIELVLLRGGAPFTAWSPIETGGFELTTPGDKLLIDEKFAVFPQVAGSSGLPGGFGVSQYPHLLIVTVTAGAARDGNGDWIPGATVTTEWMCRFEHNSSNGYIIGNDGSRIEYAGIAYMPLPVDTIAPGTKIQVYDGAIVLLKGHVKRFSKGQFNARLWL